MTLRRTFIPVGPLVIAFVTCSLAWIGGAKDFEDPAKLAAVPGAIASESGRSITLPALHDQSAIIEIVRARPLFAPGRRIPDPVKPVQEAEILPDPVPQEITAAMPDPVQEEISPPTFDLYFVGMMQVAEKMQVLLRNPLDQTEKWYSQGEEVSGWTLVEISQNAILLRHAEAEITIKMFE